MAEESQICKFYKNQTVFITGGTGFLGKILVEKLLRTTDVATIYLLIREKKGKNIHTRLDEIFDSVIFDRLKSERPKFRHHVIAISGDCSITGLGLTLTDRQKLISEVNIVFHSAATVRFDENLKLAYSINVNGTSDVIELSKQMKNLKSIIHISTAYSNCCRKSIDEKFYDTPVSYDKIASLLEKLSNNDAENLTRKIIDEWPNTYSFTKALAENLIQYRGRNLPIGIFRPSIVISTYQEPIEGWTDNLYGPAGAVASTAAGLVRIFPCDYDKIADLVPVDTCVAGIIAAAWDVANKATEKITSNIPIYNYVSSNENCLTWGEYHALNGVYGKKYPLQKAIWTIKFYAVNNRYLHLILRILVHLFPALILDLIAILLGQKATLLSTYSKVHKFTNTLTFFSQNEWKFSNDNVRELWEKLNRTDQKLFPFSMKTVLWTMYYKNYFKGMRVYLLKDPLDTLPEAKIRKRRFDFLHNSLVCLGCFLLATFVWQLIFKIRAVFTSDI